MTVDSGSKETGEEEGGAAGVGCDCFLSCLLSFPLSALSVMTRKVIGSFTGTYFSGG